MTEKEAEEIAQRAVSAAFEKLGIDKDTPDDLRHLRKWRNATETVSRTTLVVAVTVMLTGILGALWLGVQSWFGK